MHHSVPICRRR
uniref:Uncharacterized protein n=1 Tax=Anguilla anguilla TaxID=7936 RepID=A0A0E9TXC4_ANGAN